VTTSLNVAEAQNFADSLPALIATFEADTAPGSTKTVALLRSLHADLLTYIADPANAALEQRAADATAEFLRLTNAATEK
jgi:hypothetical protein